MDNDDFNEAEYESTIRTLRSEVRSAMQQLEWRMDKRSQHDAMTKVIMLSKILTGLLKLNKEV